MRPVIALLTDFGLRDHYVAAMKAVILGICPDAVLVDVTHGVEPQDVLGGSLELAACYRYFPAGTVFLAVVDPGVGSSRRPIAVEAGAFRFVAPDNGLVALALDETPPDRIVQLTEPRYALPVVSRTFEGRDRFAPAAGWIASGVAIENLGPALDDYVRLAIPSASVSSRGIDGEVLRVDRFGNLVTNIGRNLLGRWDSATTRAMRVRIGEHEIAGMVSTYADVSIGELCALVGSSERLEISVNGGSAAERLRARRGAKVRVVRGEP